MYRESTPRVIRPAGESDEYDDSDYDDGFDMPGLSSNKRRNRVVPIQPAVSNPVTNGVDDWGDDWGRGPVAGSSVQNTASISQPEVISQSEASRIACSRGDVDKVRYIWVNINCFLTS